MAMTVIYPGCDYINGNGKEAIYNSLDKTINGASNANFYTAADNSSKTGLTWGKYLAPMNQYPDIWNTTCQLSSSAMQKYCLLTARQRMN